MFANGTNFPISEVISEHWVRFAWNKLDANGFGAEGENAYVAALLASILAAPPGVYWTRPNGRHLSKLVRGRVGEWLRLIEFAGPGIADRLRTFNDVIMSLRFYSGGVIQAAALCQPSASRRAFACDCVDWDPLTVGSGNLQLQAMPAHLPRVASCVTGPMGRLGNGAALRSFSQQVLEPLKADGFLYIGLPSDNLEAVNDDATVRKQIDGILRLVHEAFGPLLDLLKVIFVQTDPSPSWLLSVLLDFGRGYNLTKLTIPAGGIWGSPLWSQRGGTLYQYYERHACFGFIDAAERGPRSGYRYEWVTFSRLDLHWVRPHEPLIGGCHDWLGVPQRVCVGLRLDKKTAALMTATRYFAETKRWYMRDSGVQS